MDTLQGNRKMVLGLLLVALGTTVDLISRTGLSANLLELLKWVGTGFFAGNVGEHLARAMSSTRSAPAAAPSSAAAPEAPESEPQLAPAPDTTGPILAGIEAIQGQNNASQQAIATVQQTLSYIITKAKIDQIP